MRLSVLAATLLLFPCVAQAQNQPAPDFDQYPSFIQVSSAAQDGTQVMLRCGYTQNGNVFNADPGYMEMTFMNSVNNSYMRYQRIDNQIIITAPTQGVPGRFLLEVIEPNGATAAKNCQTDLGSDTLQSCTGTQPFMPAAQATAQDQNAATQCGTFFNKAATQLNQSTYSAPKTEQFKNALRQKARTLLAP